MMVITLSRLAFRTAGAAFVAVWLFNLATMNLQFSSCEDLKDAAFEAEVEKRAVEGLRRLRSPSALEWQERTTRHNLREPRCGNRDRPA
jgi:hypothetical protein